MKPLVIDGVTYDPECISGLRGDIIELRNTALDVGDFSTSILLSHIIAILQHYQEILENESR